MESFKIESRHLKLCLRLQGFYQMYEGCFLLTRLTKIFNVSVNQKTRPNV